MLPTPNGAADPLSPHQMAPPPPPDLTNETTTTTTDSSPPSCPTDSEVTDSKPGVEDSFRREPSESSEKSGDGNASGGENLANDSSANGKPADDNTFGVKPPLSNQEQDEEKNASDKNLNKDSSDDKLLEFMVHVDPNGFLLTMYLVSTLVLAWRFCWLFDKPAEQFWNTSLILWLLLFVWTILVSDRPQIVITAFSYILLLSCAATHFIGQINGMMVMYIGTLYAAGLLGYYILGYCQRLGIGNSSFTLVASKIRAQKHDKVGASMLCSLTTVCSIVCFSRIAWLVLAPDRNHRTFFEAFDCLIEMWIEICGNVGLWTLYITQINLGGAVASLDTFAWAGPSFLFCGMLIGISLFLAMGDAVAILFFWTGTMALMVLFGYVLALRECYKTIVASSNPSTKWAQRADKVYLMIELAEAKDVMLKLKPDGHFNFSAKGPDEIQYELHLELFGAISVEESMVAITSGTICYLIMKTESNWWPRLFKKEGKQPVFLKVDLDKWQDEDYEDTGHDDFGDMVFVKLDKGGDNEEEDTVPSSHINGNASTEE